jgi:hypothetical protein
MMHDASVTQFLLGIFCSSMSVENDVKSEKSELAPAAVAPVPDSDSDGTRWTTTRLELWSYYLYYIGNNGLSGQVVFLLLLIIRAQNHLISTP